jgi:BMFP domain-containing protein YqiC
MTVQQKTDEFIKRIFENIPDDLRKGKEGFDKNLRAAINAAMSNMNLVTREEFDIQSTLLSRTRELVDELDAKIKELESKK